MKFGQKNGKKNYFVSKELSGVQQLTSFFGTDNPISDFWHKRAQHIGWSPVVDPGFPARGGGRRPCRGGVDSRGGYVLKILYVEMKESGPLGGMRWAHLLRPANGHIKVQTVTTVAHSGLETNHAMRRSMPLHQHCCIQLIGLSYERPILGNNLKAQSEMRRFS